MNEATVTNPEPEDDGITCDCPPLVIECSGGITLPPRRSKIGE